MNAMSEKTRLGLEILGAATVLGVSGDLLLRATPWGLNALLCTAGLVAAAAYIVHRHGIAVSADALWLAVAILLLASNFTARDSMALRALDSIGLAILCCLACLSLRGVAIRGLHAWEYVQAGFAAAVGACVGAFALVGRDVRWEELPSGGALRHLRAVGAGTLLALPLLLVFGGLFASADAVFGNVLAGAFDIDFGAVASHTFLIACGTTLAGGVLWSALLRAVAQPTGGPGRGFSLGIVPVGTALGLLDALFLLFVVIQLRYFFGGTDLIQRTTGLTYAEYARRGFFELVAASALVLPILLAADWAVRNEPPQQRRSFRSLAGLLILLLAVVMASALERMRLYVDQFGLSEVRLYATAFMVYVAGIVGWFGWTVLRGQPRRFAFGALVQGFAVLAGLHVLNPDAFIVRTNLGRLPHDRPFDAKYAASLSADAVPVLLAAVPRLGGAEQCRLSARLLARWGRGDDDWRNWNLARRRARQAVQGREADLRAVACKESHR